MDEELDQFIANLVEMLYGYYTGPVTTTGDYGIGMNLAGTAFFLFALLFMTILSIILIQVQICKTQHKKPAKVLPILFLIISIIATFNVIRINFTYGENSITSVQAERIIEEISVFYYNVGNDFDHIELPPIRPNPIWLATPAVIGYWTMTGILGLVYGIKFRNEEKKFFGN